LHDLLAKNNNDRVLLKSRLIKEITDFFIINNEENLKYFYEGFDPVECCRGLLEEDIDNLFNMIEANYDG